MLVITTPTGQIGHQTVTRLLDAGEAVRVIARDPSRLAPEIRDRVEVVAGTHADPAVVDRALAGADGLLWLIPPSLEGASARQRYLDMTGPAVEAIRAHGVGHVVGVSSAGHGWPGPAGLLTAAFAMDALLGASGAAYRALSMPAFMDNLLGQVPSIRDEGALALPYGSDLVLPLIATGDIAEVAADLLTDRTWTGQEDLPVFGPDHLTPKEMAEVISDVLGRPIAYTSRDPAAISGAMVQRGVSEGLAQEMVDMFTAQNAGIYEADHARATPTPTSFRTWCEEVLRPAVAG